MTSDMPNWLARRAQATPEAPALITPAETLSFAQLDTLAANAAHGLLALGAQPGEPVAVLLRNGPAFAALVHAAPRAGVVLLLLNTRLAAAELVFQIQNVGARLLLHDETNAALAGAVAAALPGVQLAAPPLGPPTTSFALHERITLDAVHTVIHTSGTTGSPKGALLSYGNHWWSAIGSALNLGLHEHDRWLAPLPFFHVGGLSILMRGAIYGMAVVLPAATDAAALNQAIEAHDVTIVSVVATLLQRMLLERGQRAYPPSLRCLLLGGGPAPRPLLEACAERGLPVVQTYGMTETASQVVTLAPADALRKLGSAGRPLLPNEIRVVAGEHSAAPGDVGEIQVRGPSIMQGYANRPDATAAAFDGDWLRTGDLGYQDAEGFLYVVDRRSDLIISGGENVYPAEIESVLLAHPAVADAGVVGIADPTWGQVPVAVVVLHAGHTASEAELRAFCAERLARYKLPRQILTAAELPRNAAGKLQRALLRPFFAAAGT